MIILDNFRSHHSKEVIKTAGSLNMILVFLPPYSPDLNPIEFIWKSVKREVPITPVYSEEELKDTVRRTFMNLSARLALAKRWSEKFLNKSIIM